MENKINYETDKSKLEESICKHYNVTLDEIVGRGRTDKLTEARHMLFFAIHHICKLNKSRIASEYKRDHTTVIYGINRIDILLKYHDYSKQIYNNILKQAGV